MLEQLLNRFQADFSLPKISRATIRDLLTKSLQITLYKFHWRANPENVLRLSIVLIWSPEFGAIVSIWVPGMPFGQLLRGGSY